MTSRHPATTVLAALLLVHATIPARAEPTFTAVTYNLHQGQGGPDDVVRPPKFRVPFTNIRIGLPDFKVPIARGKDLLRDIARMLEGLGPDVVFLQEVNLPSLSTLGVDQAGFLAKALGHHVAYGAAHREWRGVWKTQGNVVLSRHPILEKRVVSFHGPRGKDEARSMILARIQPPEPAPPVWVASTHLAAGNQALRLEEVKTLVTTLCALDGSLILGGDFNCRFDDREMRNFLDGMRELGKPLLDAHATAREAGEIGKQIDYIFHTEDWMTAHAREVRDIPYSDHSPWIAGLTRIPEAPGEIAGDRIERDGELATGPRLSLLGVGQ